jgi:hypothetical protein
MRRVQLGLERIVADTGSAELLPTIRDQIKDALKIVDMEIEWASRLAANRQAQAEAEQARIDLEARMRRSKKAACVRLARECSRSSWQFPEDSAEFLRIKREAMNDARSWS